MRSVAAIGYHTFEELQAAFEERLQREKLIDEDNIDSNLEIERMMKLLENAGKTEDNDPMVKQAIATKHDEKARL